MPLNQHKALLQQWLQMNSGCLALQKLKLDSCEPSWSLGELTIIEEEAVFKLNLPEFDLI